MALTERVALQATLGYHHVDGQPAKGLGVRFSRWPLNVMGVYQLADHRYQAAHSDRTVSGRYGGLLLSHYF